MIAAEPAAAGDSRGELPGGRTQRSRVSATGCPGVAASSPILFYGADRAAGQPWQLQIRNREVSDPQLALANAALVSSAVRAEAVIRRPAVRSYNRNPRTSAAREAGLRRVI